MEEYSVIGKRLPRADARIKVTGEARYTADISLPNMLTGKILRSPYPHARILNIDTSRAERLIGIKAVITGRDTPAIKYGLIDMMPEAMDKHPLVLDKARYIGDEVAAVAAIDEDTAEEALRLIQVDYEPLPAVFDPQEALKPEAPRIHDPIAGNISATTLANFGNIEEGFKKSKLVREDTFTTQLVQHATLEPHVSLASFDSQGRLTLWSSTQSIFLLRRDLARALGMAPQNVRVIRPMVGGGFGGKVEMMPLDFCAALLSQKTGRPVRIQSTREEEFTTTRRRHSVSIDLKTGVKEDGTIMAKQAKILLDGGAYNGIGPAACFLSSLWLNLPYKQPHVKVDAYRIYTNKPVCGAMRGFGSPQVHFAVEQQMDMIAEGLGIDPLELRLKNALQTGDITPNKLKITSSAFSQCLQQGAVSFKWKEKLTGKRGIGIGCSGFICGTSLPLQGPSIASANIFLEPHTDGTVTILSGVSDLGQGSDTILVQIVAEELGIPIENIRITVPDTEISPPDLLSASSRVTFMAGNAAKAAAQHIKRQLFEAVAEKLEANIEDLEAKNGLISVKGSPEKGVVFVEAVLACQEAQGGSALLGRGSYNPDPGPLNLLTGEGNYSPAYSFGVQLAEVKVDCETGKVKVLGITASHDCGVAINPMAVEGQLEGSIHMGLGYALSEQLITERGLTLNPSFIDYRILTSLDIPEIKIILPNAPDPGGPFGAKEAGEGIMSPTAGAIANALYRATGVRIKDLPLCPERVLAALEKMGRVK